MMLDPPWMLPRLNHGWQWMFASHFFLDFSGVYRNDRST